MNKDINKLLYHALKIFSKVRKCHIYSTNSSKTCSTKSLYLYIANIYNINDLENSILVTQGQS
jgi:hypothetical protein